MKEELSYKDSGVSIDEGNRFVRVIKDMVESTHSKAVIGGLGGFAGFYDIGAFKNMEEPVLVSSTDGVGTKLKIAIDAKKYDTIGIDLVAMSVNDLLVTGATPLFFLDYVATGVLSADKMKDVVAGVVAGCKESSVALLGGETAEMPGLYNAGDFDLAGFAVGILDKKKIIDGSTIKTGDVVCGLASSGFHSNGYSLLRRLFFDDLKMSVTDKIGDTTVGELLLTPTRLYGKFVRAALNAGVKINGMVHITGGGFYDNIPRVLPAGVKAVIDTGKFPKVPAIEAVKALGKIAQRELYTVFNMGIGYIFVLSREEYTKLAKVCSEMGENLYEIGTIESGNKEVLVKGIDF